MYKPYSANTNSIKPLIWLLGAGYASIMTIPPNVKYQERFLATYKEARENNRGLWK